MEGQTNASILYQRNESDRWDYALGCIVPAAITLATILGLIIILSILLA